MLQFWDIGIPGYI